MNARMVQKRIGFLLIGAGTACQVFAEEFFLLGWLASFLGAILCAKTIVGDFSWCLIAFLPVFGAPLAAGAILVQARWYPKPASSPSDHFQASDFLLIFLGLLILMVGIFSFAVGHRR